MFVTKTMKTVDEESLECVEDGKNVSHNQSGVTDKEETKKPSNPKNDLQGQRAFSPGPKK